MLAEETSIKKGALASYGITAGRIAGLTGVWVGDAKIAAIGVKLSASGVTQHGFALNVDTDLRYFQQIIDSLPGWATGWRSPATPSVPRLSWLPRYAPW